MARILFTALGSYGDLHPYMAIGLELRRRGHHVTIGTSPTYQPKITSAGLDFHPIRPDLLLDDPVLLGQLYERRRGSERVLRLVSAAVRETYQDTLPAAQRADLIVTHIITYAAVAIAQKLGLPWVSSVLAPMSMLSAYDPPVIPQAPGLVKLRAFGPGIVRALQGLGKIHSKTWIQPVFELRKELGLSSAAHPMFEGQHSPKAVLALFSPALGSPQPDWPRQTVVTGFPFLGRESHADMPADIECFLNAGPAPIVFTLGSSAVGAAGAFYRESVTALRKLGARGLLLTGSLVRNDPGPLPDGVMAAPYCPHSELFPRASAIVHQGGIGTTAEALRSGRPMLVTPLAHDQYDNAARAKRLGVAETLAHESYTAERAFSKLQKLLGEARFTRMADRLGSQIRSERGAENAANTIESVIAARETSGYALR